MSLLEVGISSTSHSNCYTSLIRLKLICRGTSTPFSRSVTSYGVTMIMSFGFVTGESNYCISYSVATRLKSVNSYLVVID